MEIFFKELKKNNRKQKKKKVVIAISRNFNLHAFWLKFGSLKMPFREMLRLFSAVVVVVVVIFY